MGSPFIGPGGGEPPPDVPPVTTPDMAERAALSAVGWAHSGFVNGVLGSIYASVIDGVKAVIVLLVAGYEELLVLIVPALTTAQGMGTDSFYALVGAILNDLLGFEVSKDDLVAAHTQRGNIGAMQKAGSDLLNTLLNEFVTGQAGTAAGSGPFSLPGNYGTPQTGQQGLDAARAFLGFILSFSVRQGNVATFTEAIPLHLLAGIREYGEMMAKNLGLGRLSRRILQPIIQATIVGPMTQALNAQYRPHILDARQLATALLRGDISPDAYKIQLAYQGYTDADAETLLNDTRSRVPLGDLYLLHENGLISDEAYLKGTAALGYDPSDFGFVNSIENLRVVQSADRQAANAAGHDFRNRELTQADFESFLGTLTLPKAEIAAIKRNYINRVGMGRKHLSLGFLKRAYFNSAITIDEYLKHAAELGYQQDELDLLEQELLVEQKLAADKIKAKAAAVAARHAKGTTPTGPPAKP